MICQQASADQNSSQPSVHVYCCRYYACPSKFCFMLGKNNCSVTVLLLPSFFFLSHSPKKVETCCWENYKQHKEKQEKLKNFKLPGFEESQEDKFLSKDSGLFEDVDDVHSWWSRYQPKVWKSLEEPYTSFWAKVSKVFLLTVDNGVDLTVWKLKVLPERVIYFLLFSDWKLEFIRSFHRRTALHCV